MKITLSRLSGLVLLTLGLASTIPVASATVITGTYTLGGATTGSGPWNMTSTDSTFSVLRFVLDTPTAFQDITNLNYGYDSNLGGIGGGAPRAVFVLDNNTSFTVHWGPAGSFTDAAIGDNLNTGNLLALNDVGRYDLSGINGSAYTDRNAALALAGSANVTRISLIIDSFGGNDRNFDINSVNVSGNAAVPDSGNTVAMLFAGLACMGLVSRSFRKKAV